MPDCLVAYLEHRTRERFEILVDEMRGHVHLVALRWTGDPVLAEDITQLVFVRILSTRWPPTRVESGAAFLTSVTISVARTLLRRRRELLQRERPMAQLPERGSELAFELERQLDTRQAVSELPPELRVCVDDKYFHNLETDEIARRLGIKRRAVQLRLRQAYVLLRRRLSRQVSLALAPVLLAPGASRATVPAKVVAALERLVERHPPEIAPTLAARARSPRRPGRRLWIAAALVLVAGVALPLGLATQSRRDGADARNPSVATPPLDVNAIQVAAGTTSAHGRWWPPAVDRFFSHLRQVDWAAALESLPPLREIPGEEENVPRRAVLRVIGRDGALVRRGRLYLLTAGEAVREEEVLPGGDGQRKAAWEVLLSCDLATSNPVVVEPGPGAPSGPLLVRILADGFPRFERAGFQLDPLGGPVEIRLESNRPVSVRVLDAITADPVAGADVRFSASAGEGVAVALAEAVTAREIAPGLYEACGLPAGPLDVSVGASDRVPILREAVSFEPWAEPLTLWSHAQAAKRAGTVVLTVHDREGKPWSGAEISVDLGSTTPRRATDEHGECVFEDLPPGHRVFKLDSPLVPGPGEEIINECRFLVRPGRTRRTSLGRLPPPGELLVTVEDARGDPAAGVLVQAEGPMHYSARTGPGGIARFPQVPGGEYSLVLGSGAPVPWALAQVARVDAGEQHRASVRVGERTVRGRIISPLLGGIRVLADAADRTTVAELDPEGGFELRGVPSGQLALKPAGEMRGFLYGKRVVVDVPPDSDPAEVEIRLEGLCVLWIEEGEAADVAAPTIKALVTGPGGAVRLSRRSSGIRARELAGLVDPGTYHIALTAPDGTRLERTVTLEPGEERRERFEFGR